MEVALNSFEADCSSDLVTWGKGLATVFGIKCQFWFPFCCHLVSREVYDTKGNSRIAVAIGYKRLMRLFDVVKHLKPLNYPQTKALTGSVSIRPC